MWVHLLVFLAAPCLLLLDAAGKLPETIEKKRKRLCLFVLLLGNLFGCVLTVRNNRELDLGRSVRLPRKEYEDGWYEETLELETAEETLRLPVEVPPKEGQESFEEAPPPKKESLAEAVQAEILRLNQEKNDPSGYYLPDTLNGETLSWRRPYNTQGTLLGAFSLVAAAVLLAASGREKEEEKKRVREQMALDYPGLVMKLSLLLEAGLPVGRAFRKTALDYRKNRKEGAYRFAYEEMLTACQEMDGGISEEEAYRRFGRRCGELRYKTLSTLLVQNLKKGSRGLLEALETEADQAFEERKRRARVLGEQAATKLLVPMVLMLVVVIVILVVPAFLSFYS